MLSRAADNLYWMARYIERAENLARMLDVTYRMSLVPQSRGDASGEWMSLLSIAGLADDFLTRHTEADSRSVIEYMALDPQNPSSILVTIRGARENARAVRAAMTSEMWESLNGTWLEARDVTYDDLVRGGFSTFFDWVKDRSHLFRGVAMGTMLRDDAFEFTRLGTFIERADSTARILDVKYHVLLPQSEEVGGVVDYYQWAALLRSVSALKAYTRVYHHAIVPWRVAEFLVLRADMPRSLHACFQEIDAIFDRLRQFYGQDQECYRLAGEIYARLRYGRMEQIFQQGLHQFLVDFLARNGALGDQIARDFMMTA